MGFFLQMLDKKSGKIAFSMYTLSDRYEVSQYRSVMVDTWHAGIKCEYGEVL
jgi:hypothetical protein